MPISMILELALALVSGAGVGWITNSIAITMLFKKYGRWGGVIEENYESFIQNMSQLVEDDLVNPKTLEGELNAPPFQSVLYAWVEDFLKKELPEHSGSIRFEEIPGIAQTLESLIRLLRELDQPLIAAVYRRFEDTPIQGFLSKQRYEYIIDAHIPLLRASQEELKTILDTFFAGSQVQTLLSQDAIRRIILNIQNQIQRVHFSQFDPDLDHAVYTFLRLINLDRIIEDLEQSLGGMGFADFIKDSQDLSQKLIARFIAFSQSPQGQTLLLEVIENLLQDGKRLQLRIDQAVSPGVKAGITAFIQDKVPGILDRITDFIDETSDEIEVIINRAVDRHLNTTSEGLFLKVMKDLFLEDPAKRFNVVNRIISAIHKHGDTAGDRIAAEIHAFIENKTLGDLIGILEKKQILTPQGLAGIINLNLGELSRKDSAFLEKGLHTEINRFWKPDLSAIQTVLLPALVHTIKKDYLYQDKFKKDLQSLIEVKITKMTQRPWGDFFSLQKSSWTLPEQTIKNYLLNQWDTIAVTPIGKVIPQKPGGINWEALWNRHKHRTLNQVYQGIQKESIYKKITQGIMEILNQRLDRIITGKVSYLVKAELTKSSPAQIRDMVQDFMGKELKPINLFGAFLGAAAGVLSVGIAFLWGAPQEFTWWMLLIYGAVFSLTAIGTNWLAVKMLFRPYKKILFNRSPFIGIAALRKPQFAKSISRFVKEKTLNDEALSQFFMKNKPALQEKSLLWLAEGDYALIDALFQDEQRLDQISHGIFSALQTYSTQHSDSIAEAIAGLLEDILASGKLGDALIQGLQKNNLAAPLSGLLVKAMEGKQIGQYPQIFSSLGESSLTEILVQALRVENIKAFLYSQEDTFTAYTASHSFADLAGPQVTAGIVQGIAEKAGKLLPALGDPLISYFEKRECNPEIKLKDLFNGAVGGILERHLDYFLGLISREIAGQKGALVKQITDEMPWYAAPAKGQVGPIVDLLIDQELPQFLNQKKSQILSIAHTLLEYQLSDLGFTSETLNTLGLKQGVSAVLKAPQVQRSVTHLVKVAAEQYTRIPLQSILALLNITSIRDLADTAEPLLDTLVSSLKARLLQDDAAAFIAGFAQYGMHTIADKIAVADLLEGVNLEQEVQNLMTALVHDKGVMESVSGLLRRMLGGGTPGIGYLQKDLAAFIARISDQDWDQLRQDTVPLVKVFFQRLNHTLGAETKQGICREYLIPGALNTGERHFKELIQGIDIQKVVEQEVNAMDPREIETLFNKFAGAYFTKIILYGWIGVFGGLLSYLISSLLKAVLVSP